MEYPTNVIQQLFIDVAHKANTSLEYSDKEFLATDINQNDFFKTDTSPLITGDYIYETFGKIKKAVQNEEDVITFNPSFINRIAQYAGARDFNRYKESLENSEEEEKETPKSSPSKTEQSTYMGRNINRIDGDMNNGTINNN